MTDRPCTCRTVRASIRGFPMTWCISWSSGTAASRVACSASSPRVGRGHVLHDPAPPSGSCSPAQRAARRARARGDGALRATRGRVHGSVARASRAPLGVCRVGRLGRAGGGVGRALERARADLRALVRAPGRRHADARAARASQGAPAAGAATAGSALALALVRPSARASVTRLIGFDIEVRTAGALRCPVMCTPSDRVRAACRPGRGNARSWPHLVWRLTGRTVRTPRRGSRLRWHPRRWRQS